MEVVATVTLDEFQWKSEIKTDETISDTITGQTVDVSCKLPHLLELATDIVAANSISRVVAVSYIIAHLPESAGTFVVCRRHNSISI